jgi:hypothetical protein
MDRSLLQKYILVTNGILIFLTIPFFLGGIVALFLASFSIKLGILIGCLFVLVLCLLVPAGTKVLTVLLRYLIFTLEMVSTVWPSYLSYQGSVGKTVNATEK